MFREVLKPESLISFQEVLERFSQQERRLKEQEAIIQELHRKLKVRRESVESADYHHTKVL
jgi:hypothetical protein